MKVSVLLNLLYVFYEIILFNNGICMLCVPK